MTVFFIKDNLKKHIPVNIGEIKLYRCCDIINISPSENGKNNALKLFLFTYTLL